MTKEPKGENFKHTTILAGANAYPQRGVVEAVVLADKAARIAEIENNCVKIGFHCFDGVDKYGNGEWVVCPQCEAKIRAIKEEA